MIRSPSFSLPSSSMTTRNSPRAKASKASSIESNPNPPARPFVLAGGLPLFVSFEFEDDRGLDITSLCLKSAMGAISKSCELQLGLERDVREEGGGKDKVTSLKRKDIFEYFICGLCMTGY